MKSGGGARLNFLISFFLLAAVWAPEVGAGVPSICQRAITWLRLRPTAFIQRYDIEKPIKPIKGVIDAVAVSIERDGKFLLGYRVASPMKNQWGQFGGKLEPGESVTAAARRELLEEIGIEAESFRFEFAITSYLAENGNHYRVFVVTAILPKGEPQNLEPHKTSELRWFSPSQIPHYLTSATDAFFRRMGVRSSGIFARP